MNPRAKDGQSTASRAADDWELITGPTGLEVLTH